ncbi:unnamed protein product [Durusdinium trenchii]|uniref:Uncharacterized protein n=1 Tax=Durusdinium trenchii TaxID=1381693 RepID=A0ABP0ME39_9DINO
MRAYDLFGGALCARHAWRMIESAALELWGVQPTLEFTFNVEKNWACIKMAKDNFPDSCIFPDIMDCVANPPKKKNWNPSDLKLVKECHCVQHRSEYGLREGFKTKNIKVKQAHDTAMAFQQKTPISIHENVPDYAEAYLKQHLTTHDEQKVLPQPKQLRVWRILYDKDSRKWDCPYTLGELANLLLAPLESKLNLDFNAYLCASPSELQEHNIKEHELSESQKKHLQIFRKVRPDKAIYDLSANALKRCRTETVDQCMPCLTTSSQLWSENAGRLMLGKEQMHILGFPCIAEAANAARVDYVYLDHISESSLRSISGNGMSLPCAGFIMLMTVLCVSHR